jgi:23S rRNA (adenine2503-C2)-methyltransferase
MGMGEPMLNYDALWQAIEMLNSPDGFGLGARNMTVSTAGLIPEIKRLSGEKLQVGLAISLHAATDELRGQLVPINRKYSLKPLIAACKEYFEKTGRRLSFEYILFEGINDSSKDARALAHVVQGLNCHVNLIPANPTRERQYRPPTQETVLAFETELKRLHINCTVRSRKGVDIDAGCGQLRSRFLKPGRSSQKQTA